MPPNLAKQRSAAAIRLSPDELQRRILIESDDLAIVDKPWGLPTSGQSLDDSDCLQHALITRYGEMTWAVHQLDADTSGLNIFARRKSLVAHWKERMASPNGIKTYLAVVHGRAEFDQKRVDAPIGVLRDQPGHQLGVCPNGRSAVSDFRVVRKGRDASLLAVQIQTGRTHQIRIHLAQLGHPLLGEEWYSRPPSTAHYRQALHAWRLEFADDEDPRSIECPLPRDLSDLVSTAIGESQ